MKGQSKKGKKAQQQAAEMPSDSRFEEVYSDPRFMRVPQKIKKVEIDDRFKKGLKSKEFNMVAKVDKYGKKVNQQDKTMLNFYNVNSKKESNEGPKGGKKGAAEKYYDDEGRFKWEQQSSSEEEDEEDDENEDEEEKQSEEEVDQDESDLDDVQNQDDDDEEDLSIWSEKEDEQQQEGEVKIGKRLALTNMDWDNISALDILALFTSFCKGEMAIYKVEIYPSLFGLEQMKNDAIYGPPKQLFDETKKGKGRQKKKAADEDDDFLEEDEEADEGYNEIQLRKYEANKMKYFYAVIHCNSKKTANHIYEEYNSFELEQSNIKLTLAFIDDELTFPQKAKEIASDIPPDYEFKAAQYLNRAFNHTKAKLTWDITDPKRLQKFAKIMDKEDADDEEYREFLASASENEEQDEEMEDKDQIEAYRQKLLGALSDTKGEDVFNKRDLQEQQDGDEDQLDIKFSMGFGEDVGKKFLKDKKDKKEKKEKEGESEWQKYQRKRKEKRKEKKLKVKEEKEAKKYEDSDSEDKERRRAELELLVGEKQNGAKDVKANTKDKRFEAVLKSKEYAIDPTHKNFRKIADSEYVKEKQNLKRRKHNDD